MKKIGGGPVTAAAFALVIATALILTISYAYAMGCPSDGADRFNLHIESVTVDGVQQEDLSAYHILAATLLAEVPQSQTAGGGEDFTVDRVILRFEARVEGPGSYDENFGLDPDNR